MPDIDFEKLEGFTRAILDDALEESGRIYEEVRLENERAISAAEDEALNEAFHFIKTEVAKIRSDAGRRISHKVMESKRRNYLRREEMTEQVMGQVVDKIGRYVKSEEYPKQMGRIISKALDMFDADTIIYLRAEDMRLAPELSKLRAPHALHFEEGAFTLGGLQAFCPSKGLRIDESFDATFEELREHFAEMFGLELAD